MAALPPLHDASCCDKGPGSQGEQGEQKQAREHMVFLPVVAAGLPGPAVRSSRTMIAKENLFFCPW